MRETDNNEHCLVVIKYSVITQILLGLYRQSADRKSTGFIRFLAICRHYQILQICVKFAAFLISEIYSRFLKICFLSFVI